MGTMDVPMDEARYGDMLGKGKRTFFIRAPTRARLVRKPSMSPGVK